VAVEFLWDCTLAHFFVCYIHAIRRAGLSSVHVHKAVVKIAVLKFVIEVWLKCIEITTTKKVVSFYGEKIVEAPPKTAHTLPVNPG